MASNNKSGQSCIDIYLYQGFHDAFEYKDGSLFWKSPPCNSIRSGDIAGSVDKKGYLRVRFRGKWLMQHRVVWIMHHVFIAEGMQVDHINHDRADNRIENLRIVDGFENGRNRTKNKNNQSGVTGVYFKTSHNKWAAGIRIGGKNKHLGYFSKIDGAIQARKTAEKQYNFHENHGAAK